jgi:hypothetical protein
MANSSQTSSVLWKEPLNSLPEQLESFLNLQETWNFELKHVYLSWDGRMKCDTDSQQNRGRYLQGIIMANRECGKNGDSDNTY